MPRNIDWFYFRKNCVTCKRAQDYLENNGRVAKEIVDARLVRIEPASALELLQEATRLVVAKGKKVVDLNLKKERPDNDELQKLILGPSGFLRAPTIRIGKTYAIGFTEEMYRDFIGE